MKKNYSKFARYTLFCILLTVKLNAQLSGVVTINNLAPSTALNYTSFSAFAAVINTAGISGPLTVDVISGSGPYNEQVEFRSITGVSATNTITVNGNGCSITASASSATLVHTFMLSGTDFMRVHNLSISGTGGTYALPLHLWNASDNNSFISCTITVNPNINTAVVVPVSVSGTSVSATAVGTVPGGSHNEFRSCRVNNGNFGMTFYSQAASPVMEGNKVIDCTVLNANAGGISASNVTDQVIRGNFLSRPNAGIFPNHTAIQIIANTQKSLIENNKIENPAVTGFTSTATFAGIIVNASTKYGNENVVRNNLITNIRGNGEHSGIRSFGYGGILIHNTIVLDDASSPAGATYGIFSAAGPYVIKNNIITITRSGTGAKYCLYYSSIMNHSSDHNVLYINSPAGNNNIGYLSNTDIPSLAAWQSVNGGAYDQNSVDVDPVYAMPGSDYTPTNPAVNNLGVAMGLGTDIQGAVRNLASPDPGAIEFFNMPCAGNPALSTITSPGFSVCSGTSVQLSLAAGVYTNSGISYQWVASGSSALGPFTPVPGATLTTLTPPSATNSVYYSVEVTCASGGTTTLPGVQLDYVPLTTSTVPYYEDFETLNQQVQLPNCSWVISNSLTAMTQTLTNPAGRKPLSGANFAMFFASQFGSSYFYTNGIHLNAGVTYSASLWYLTESFASPNWSDLSVFIGPGQTPAGLMPVASSNGSVNAPVHKPLSGTFTVATSGVYYMAVRATAVNATTPVATYLSFDDLRIEVPCTLNSFPVQVNMSEQTVCSGQTLTLSASGADTYTWNTGENTSSITVMPALTTSAYTVSATQQISGCTASFVQTFTVHPSPSFQIFTSSGSDEVCSGSAIVLNAFGTDAGSYSWDNGASGPSIIVSPTVTTTYSVAGKSNEGCYTTLSKQISVNPLPVVSVPGLPSARVCLGESLRLIASGAQVYTWLYDTATVYLGNPITFTPQTSAVFTVSGTDIKGCTGTKLYTLAVERCTGIEETAGEAGGLQIYPNPSQGLIMLHTASSQEKIIKVSDPGGRIVMETTSAEPETRLDLSTLASGVYFVTVTTGTRVHVSKVIKTDY